MSDADSKKEKPIKVRLSSQQYEIIAAAADAKGMPPATFLRMAGLEAAQC